MRRAEERLIEADITPTRTLREIASVAYTPMQREEIGITGILNDLRVRQWMA